MVLAWVTNEGRTETAVLVAMTAKLLEGFKESRLVEDDPSRRASSVQVLIL